MANNKTRGSKHTNRGSKISCTTLAMGSSVYLYVVSLKIHIHGIFWYVLQHMYKRPSAFCHLIIHVPDVSGFDNSVTKTSIPVGRYGDVSSDVTIMLMLMHGDVNIPWLEEQKYGTFQNRLNELGPNDLWSRIQKISQVTWIRSEATWLVNRK